MVIIIVLVVVFVMLYLLFGRLYGSDKLNNYKNRSINMSNNKFNNKIIEIDTNYKEYKIISNKGSKPKELLPVYNYNYIKSNIDEVLLTWFSHSTILLQMNCLNILIDPIFSIRSSPVSFIGPKRYNDVSNIMDKLPNIDICIITHNHYDHLDYKSIKKLDSKINKYIVPLGVENYLNRMGINNNKITNMAWWEELDINELIIGCTPSRHFSGRYILDSNKSLWSSFIFKNNNNTIYYSSDTGYGKHFKDIYNKYGSITLGLFDCAQYNKNWTHVHMFPEESIMSAKELHCDIIMPIHWGAFKLSNHPWDDPVVRFVKKSKEENIKYLTPRIGETINIKELFNYQIEWWRDIK